MGSANVHKNKVDKEEKWRQGWLAPLYRALFFAWLGSVLDKKIGSTPAFTLLGALVGGAAGFYNLVRRAMALQEGDSHKRNDEDGEVGPSGKAPDKR
jgi:hypothetical protein